jgi:hypothetical protein
VNWVFVDWNGMNVLLHDDWVWDFDWNLDWVWNCEENLTGLFILNFILDFTRDIKSLLFKI